MLPTLPLSCKHPRETLGQLKELRFVSPLILIDNVRVSEQRYPGFVELVV